MAASQQRGNALPDEIVKEIFAFNTNLFIPRERFESNAEVSPFVDSEYSSTAALLLVCKQWLRIATPSLYHTIILRSKAQAQALERTFAENEELGKFARQLRLEGVYGPPMAKIIQSVPQTTDLFLTLTVWPSEDPTALIDSLPLLNPTNLILYDVYSSKDRNYPSPLAEYKSDSQLLSALLQCLKTWKVKHVGFPFHPSYNLTYRNGRLAQALAISPDLRTVRIDFIAGMYDDMICMSRNPSLKSIEITWAHYYISPNDTRLRNLVRCKGKLAAFSHSQIPSPLLASQKFEDAIWKRILGYAMSFDWENGHEEYFRSTEVRALTLVNSQRINVVKVCKTFLRLGFPVLYHHPILFSASHLNVLVKALDSKPATIRHVQCIMLSTPRIQPWKSKRPINVSFKAFSTVFSQLRLVAFGASTHDSHGDIPLLPLWAFEDLCENSSATLQHLYPINLEPEADARLLLEYFGKLKKLRTLSWRATKASFAGCEDVIASNMLEKLEDLEYNQDGKAELRGPSLLIALCRMDLPSLRTFRFSSWRPTQDLEPFLAKHGNKITNLTLCFGCLDGKKSPFDLCPDLRTLVILENALSRPQMELFDSSVEHANLSKIVYQPSLFLTFHSHVLKLDPEHWASIFDPALYSKFPSLREIQIPFRLWPLTEHEIESGENPWPAWAEKLHDGGIKLTDHQGKGWIARLQVASYLRDG